MAHGPGNGRVVGDVTTRGGNANRDRIHLLIVEKPGLNIQEIADATGIQRTAVNHHIRNMVRLGDVVKRRQGLNVLHFPCGMAPMQVKALSCLRVPSIHLVVEQIYHEPTVAWSVIADRNDLNERTVRRAIQTLESEHLLHVERRGRSKQVCHLHPELRMVLVRWGPGNGGDEDDEA